MNGNRKIRSSTFRAHGNAPKHYTGAVAEVRGALRPSSAAAKPINVVSLLRLSKVTTDPTGLEGDGLVFLVLLGRHVVDGLAHDPEDEEGDDVGHDEAWVRGHR